MKLTFNLTHTEAIDLLHSKLHEEMKLKNEDEVYISIASDPFPTSRPDILEIDSFLTAVVNSLTSERIESIKTVRHITGCSLRDAKDLVDKWLPFPHA